MRDQSSNGGVVDDVLPDLPVEDLRAAAGQRFEAGVDQLIEMSLAGRPEISRTLDLVA